MPRNATHRLVLAVIASAGLVASSQSLSNESLRKESLPNLFPFPNAKGLLETYNITDQPIDLTGPASIPGTCGTCHDSPNVGNHSVSAPLNIGFSDLDSPLDLSYLPVFTLRNRSTGEIKKTTDPGRALITGAWKDVGRLKGPILSGLPARAPYFHNGSAETLEDVIEFYNKRFNIGFSAQEKKDLIAFLNTL